MTLEEAITQSERLAKTSRYPYTPIIMTVVCDGEVLILRESDDILEYNHHHRQSKLLKRWMAAHK